MNNNDSAPATPKQSVFTTLSSQPRSLAIGLFVVGILLAIIPVVLGLKYGNEHLFVAVWGGILSALAIFSGIWVLLRDSNVALGVEITRMVVFVFGGLGGFFTWLLSFNLAYKWKATVFGGLDAWQGAESWQLWVCLLAMLGGLTLMFVSLLPVRVAERTQPTLRQMIYGYNAALGGLLVLAILIIGNVLVYNYSVFVFDWTQGGIYSLAERSRNILKSLEKPTKVYVVMTRGNATELSEMQTLLDNCRAVNDKLEWESIGADRDFVELRRLSSDFGFNERQGVLVVYGEEGKTVHQTIKYNDIFAPDQDPSGAGGGRFVFKGEDALMTALNSLQEGKTKTTIYFTQKNGELDITSMDTRDGWFAGILRERLEKSNYEVKGLQFTPGGGVKNQSPTLVLADRVPDDAAIVVVAGPRNPLPDFALNALRQYMNPPGKDPTKKGSLVVLLDVNVDATGEMRLTGMENFLTEFNVQVGRDRILTVPSQVNRDPVRVIVTADSQSGNPIGSRFEGRGFLIPQARTIKPMPAGNPMQPKGFVAESIFQVAPGQYSWAETDLRTEPGRLVQSLVKENKDELIKKIRQSEQDGLPVALAVGEPSQPAANDPHAFAQPRPQKPRLVVFGCASFVSNRYTGEASGGVSYDIFAGSLAWLRERPSSIGLEAKKRSFFTLNVTDDAGYHRMLWLPGTVILLSIMGLGTGVWIMRRR